MVDMQYNIIVYEDHSYEKFMPLVYLRSVFELRIGMLSFLERIHLFFSKSKYHLVTRDYLKPVLSQRYPKYFVNSPNIGLKALIINGRTVMNKKLADLIKSIKDRDFLIVSGNKVLAIGLRDELLSKFLAVAKQVQFKDEEIINFLKEQDDIKIVNLKDCLVIDNIWTIIKHNADILMTDFKLLKRGGLFLTNLNTQVALSREESIFVGKRSKIDPFVHLDARKGPIYIGEDVVIKSNTVIEGPVMVDDRATIYSGYINNGTTIGEGCKVGGEIEASIFLENSNKHHAGFIGHSYVGQWVNIGALTTTSDLKNNYSDVKLTKAKGDVFSTGLTFMGSIIGDHVKFGIGTMLNTGTIVGVGSNVVGAKGVEQKWIPSFSWSNGSVVEEYQFDKFIQTVESVYGRRKKNLLLPEKNLLEYIYKLSTRTEAAY